MALTYFFLVGAACVLSVDGKTLIQCSSLLTKSPKLLFFSCGWMTSWEGWGDRGAGCLWGLVHKLLVPAVPGVCHGMGCSLTTSLFELIWH